MNIIYVLYNIIKTKYLWITKLHLYGMHIFILDQPCPQEYDFYILQYISAGMWSVHIYGATDLMVSAQQRNNIYICFEICLTQII